jgi:hypothetical protein
LVEGAKTAATGFAKVAMKVIVPAVAVRVPAVFLKSPVEVTNEPVPRVTTPPERFVKAEEALVEEATPAPKRMTEPLFVTTPSKVREPVPFSMKEAALFVTAEMNLI